MLYVFFDYYSRLLVFVYLFILFLQTLWTDPPQVNRGRVELKVFG